MMKSISIAIAVAALFAGCMSRKSPYDCLENWLIREDPIRPFFVSADLIYVQGAIYVDMSGVPAMHTYAKDEVGKGRFNGIARVFSPLVASEEDLEQALKWYFDLHHSSRRMFVFVGEGAGGAMLKAYEQKHAEDLAEEGLVASFYTEESGKGFVTDAMVREIRNAIARARYRMQWGRDMPEGKTER